MFLIQHKTFFLMTGMRIYYFILCCYLDDIYVNIVDIKGGDGNH